MPDGLPVQLFSLQGSGGFELRAMNYGATVTHLRVPDGRGDVADVVLGFNSIAGYLQPHPYLGVTAGRVAGRISGARFTLDGREYQLAANDPPNHLHGGDRGFDKRLWAAEALSHADGSAVRFTRTSPDGEEGYPGNLRASVTYVVTPNNEFVVETEVTTDRATPVTLTHHSYFNLAGEGSGSIEGQELQLMASTYAPADGASGLIGRRDPVTDNDLRDGKVLGSVIPRLRARHGDLYFLDRGSAGPGVLVEAARLVDPVSRRVLSVRTTEACLQFYTGVGLTGKLIGKSGRAYGPLAGLCLECEGYPDGVNRPELGKIILRPGEVSRHRTVYAFSTF